MDVTQRFSDRVAAYAEARIGYPPEFVDHLRKAIGLAPGWTVADMGSGTGLSAEPLLDAGCSVIGVEPSDSMRAAAEAALGGRPGFRSVAGRAEASGLPDGCADLAVAACAFHWFDPGATAREWGRVLRGEKWAALLWTLRRPEASAFMGAFEGVIERWGTDWPQVKARYAEPGAMGVLFGVGAWEVARFGSHQVVDWAGLAARVRSTSYVPGPGKAGHDGMMADLRAVYEAHAVDDRVRIEYAVPMFYGRVVA